MTNINVQHVQQLLQLMPKAEVEKMLIVDGFDVDDINGAFSVCDIPVTNVNDIDSDQSNAPSDIYDIDALRRIMNNDTDIRQFLMTGGMNENEIETLLLPVNSTKQQLNQSKSMASGRTSSSSASDRNFQDRRHITMDTFQGLSSNSNSSSSSSTSYDLPFSKQLHVSPCVIEYLGASALIRCINSLREKNPEVVFIRVDELADDNRGKTEVTLILESVFFNALGHAYQMCADVFIPAFSAEESLSFQQIIENLDTNENASVWETLLPKAVKEKLRNLVPDYSRQLTISGSVLKVILQNRRKVCRHLEKLYNVKIRVVYSHVNDKCAQLSISHSDSEEALEICYRDICHYETHPAELEQSLKVWADTHKIYVFVDISNIEMGFRNMADRLNCGNHQTSSSSSSNNSATSTMRLDAEKLMEIVTNLRQAVRMTAVGSYSHYSSANARQSHKSNGSAGNSSAGSGSSSLSPAAVGGGSLSKWERAGCTVLSAARDGRGREQLVDEAIHVRASAVTTTSFCTVCVYCHSQAVIVHLLFYSGPHSFRHKQNVSRYAHSCHHDCK